MMTIPDYQTVILPLLRFAADGHEHSLREAIEKLADHFDLNEEERKELLPSGAQATRGQSLRWPPRTDDGGLRLGCEGTLRSGGDALSNILDTNFGEHTFQALR